jgi:hypothetical protein
MSLWHFYTSYRLGCQHSMRLFHPINSLVVCINLWTILLSKIWLFFKFSQRYINTFLKFWGFQICAYFFSSFSGCWVISHFVMFTKLKLQNISGTHTATWQLKLAADFSSLKIRPLGRIHNTSSSSKLTNGLNKLACLSLTNLTSHM